MIKKITQTIALVGCLGFGASANATLITNNSFETGDFTGWLVQDLGVPYLPLQVGGSGISQWGPFFTSSPTDGSFAALNGFDGNGPGIIRIGQEITVTNQSTIQFDYRAAWDLNFGATATLNRLFDVNIEPAGGGANLASFNFLTAIPNSVNNDTGNLRGSVDLSSFIGQTVLMSFDWEIPQTFTGPGFFQLDNVSAVSAVPEPATLALFGIGLAGLGFARKKKKSA